MKVFLVILFLVNGEWVTVDGWGERPQENYETCMQRALHAATYIAEAYPTEIAAVSCRVEEE